MSEMSDKFIYETENTTTWNIKIPKECIGKIKGELNLKAFALYCNNFGFSPNWKKPAREMPIKLDVKFYLPIPKTKQPWFKSAARRGMIPEVLFDKWKAMTDFILPLLKQTLIINNQHQIHSINFEAAYSIHPRMIIKVTAMYQNIGDIKSAISRAVKEEKDVRNEMVRGADAESAEPRCDNESKSL